VQNVWRELPRTIDKGITVAIPTHPVPQQVIRLDEDIVVDEQEQIALGQPRAAVSSARGTAMMLGVKRYLDVPTLKLANNLGRGLIGSIVDDDHLVTVALVVEGQQRREGIAQRARPAEGGHYDGEGRVSHFDCLDRVRAAAAPSQL
jgi:hypothetical protein